jgi:hypothetical protein
MEKLPLPTYPELEPDIALFSLLDLYRAQPVEVLESHLVALGEEAQLNNKMIEYCDFELIERSIGVEDPPEGFQEVHEQMDTFPDYYIEEQRENHQDRILTLMSHISIVAALQKDRAHSPPNPY